MYELTDTQVTKGSGTHPQVPTLNCYYEDACAHRCMYEHAHMNSRKPVWKPLINIRRLKNRFYEAQLFCQSMYWYIANQHVVYMHTFVLTDSYTQFRTHRYIHTNWYSQIHTHNFVLTDTYTQIWYSQACQWREVLEHTLWETRYPILIEISAHTHTHAHKDKDPPSPILK